MVFCYSETFWILWEERKTTFLLKAFKDKKICHRNYIPELLKPS